MDDLRGFLMEEMAVEGSAGITLTALRQAIEAYEEERIKQNGGLKQLLDESWTNYVWRSMRGIPGVVAGGLKTVAEARQEQAPRSNDEPSNHDATPSAGDAATKGKRRQKQAIQSFLDTINVDAETRSADISQLETRHTDRLRFGLTRELLLAKLTKGDASSTMSDLTFATLQIVVRSKSAGVSFPEIGAVLGIDSKTIFHHVRVLTQKNLVSKYNETRNKARVAAVVANRFREGNAVWKMEQNSVMAVEKASKAGKNAKSQQQQQRAEHADEGADADADADAAQEEEEDDKAQDEENEEAKMLSIEPSLLETRMVLGATQDSAALHAEEDFLAVLDSSTATRGSVPPVNQQKDVKEAAAEAVEGLEGEDAETLLAYPQLTKMEGQVLARDTSKVLLVRIIRLAYLSSNHILPRKFIRQRLGWHGHAGAFGSAAGVKNRISARIYSALNAGYLDNVRAKTSSGGVQNCIRLLPAGIKWSEEFLSSAKDKAMARVTASLKYELNRLQQGRIARGVPLERQLSEIVCATGLTGISTMQLAAVLGATYQGRRSIDHLMRSMEESYNGPVNRISRTMCDALIVAATDHSGRLKYARYWSQLAHACLRKGSSLDATQEGDVTWDEAQAIHQWPLSEQAPPAISREEVAKAWRTALKEGTDAAPEADEDNDASGRARKKSKATGNHADSPVAPKKRGRPRKEKTEPDPNTPVVKKRRPYPLKPFESLTLAGQRSRIKIDKRNREEAEAAADAAAAERALDMLEVQGEHEAQDATAGIDDEPLLTPQEQVDADAHDPEESLERSASIREASRNVPEVSANASPAAATSASPAPSASAAARSATPANTSNRGRLRAMGRTKARSLNHSQARDSWLKTQRAKYGRDLMEKIGVVDFIMLPVEYQKYVQGVLSADAAQMEVGNCQDVRTRRQMVDALVEVGAVKTFKCISHLTGRQVEVIHHKDCPWEKVQQYTQTLSTSEHSVLTRSAQMRAVWRAAPLAGVQVDVPEALQANKAPRDMGPFSHIFSTQELLDNPKHHETLWQLSLARYQLLGYLPGSIARLRHLHRALVAILVGKPAQVFSYVCSSIGQPDSPSGEVPAIVSRPKSIISIDKLVNDTIQLRHIFKMFAIEPEEEVVQLAQSSQQCVMALGRQTERIRGSMQQTVKLQILQYFQRLHILGLVEPVMWQPNEEDDDKDHCWISTENQETSEFYEVKLGYMSQLGVTRQGNASFVARSLPLFSVEDCDAYWSTMFARNYALKHPSIQADKLKDAPVSVLLGLDLHWSRHRSSRYYLLTAQKQFLELFVKDARRSASSQTQDEGNVFFDNVDRIRRIAKAVVMPVWALVQYLLTMSKTTLPDGHPLKSLRHTSEEDGRSPSAFRGRRLLRQEGAPRGADLVPALDLNETAQSAVGESAEAREKKIEEREARREEWDEALRELLREAGFELAHDKVWEAMRVLRNTYAKTPDELTLDEGLDSARSAIKALRDELNPESAAQHAEKPMTAAEKERERKRQLRAFAKEYRADKESGPVRPDTSFRQRHSALMWTKASDELLRDAAVILRARDKERNAIQTNWIALRQIFPFAYRQGTVIKRYRYLISTIGEAAYLDELEAQWTRLWKKYRGTQYLEDLHPGHPTLFDLPQHIRFLRSHIDKENIYTIIEQAEADPLPLDPSELLRGLKIDREPAHTAWQTAGVGWDFSLSLTVRQSALHNMAFGLDVSTDRALRDEDAQAIAGSTSSLEVALASAFARMRVAGGAGAEQIDVTTAVASHVGEDNLGLAIKHLLDVKAIRWEREKRQPGNNFVWVDNAFVHPYSSIDVRQIADAVKKHVDAGQVQVLPNLGDTEIAALLTLSSDHVASPDFNMKSLETVAQQYKINTRRIDDELMEMLFNLKIDSGSHDPSLAIPAIPAQEVLRWLTLTDKQLQLRAHCEQAWEAQVKKAKGALKRCLAQLYEVVLAAGQEGAVWSQLQAQLAESSSDTIEKAIDLALHASPPLLFWAGYDVTRLVDASYLVQWTIPIAAEPVEEREPSRSPSVELVDAPNKRRRRQPREGGSPDLPRLLLGREQDVDAPRRYDAGARRASAVKMRGRIFPRIWYDLYGNIVEKEWERGLGVVLGWVFEQPGVTQVHLIKLLSPTYDRLEAVELIEGACATQAISKRTPTSVSGSPDPDPDQVALLPTSKDWTSWASSSRTDALKPFISRFATAAFKGAKRVAAAIEERDKESLEGSASDGEGEGEGADEDEDEDEEDEDEDEDEQEDEQEED